MNKENVIKEFKVKPNINVESEIRSRVDFIKNQLIQNGLKSLVLGISGGVDSSVAGNLCQMAVNELNQDSKMIHITPKYNFIGVRIPYGKQLDSEDVNLAFEQIKPSIEKSVNIKQSVDETVLSLNIDSSTKSGDFIKGNIKARQRMLVQYAIANESNGLVVGTDHSAEGVMGFFTKFGDGACDIAPLFGLNKRQIRSLAENLGVPKEIINKAPTADLEDLNPQLKDEEAYGVTYEDIDNFLEGKDVSTEVVNIILRAYTKTEHKRSLPVTIYDSL